MDNQYLQLVYAQATRSVSEELKPFFAIAVVVLCFSILLPIGRFAVGLAQLVVREPVAAAMIVGVLKYNNHF